MVGADVASDALAAALEGGDVASVIVSPIGADDRLDEAAFAARAQTLVPLAQAAGVAAIVAFETRVCGRSGADGVHLEGVNFESPEARGDVERMGREMSVGLGNVTDRHAALAAGEMQPDYVFFGRLHRDIRPEPHEKNLKLARWWSHIVALPCIVSGGNIVESVVDVAETGADFVALQSAIFAGDDPRAAVTRANRLLDEHAPLFEDALLEAD